MSDDLKLGDRVWFRLSTGEMLEGKIIHVRPTLSEYEWPELYLETDTGRKFGISGLKCSRESPDETIASDLRLSPALSPEVSSLMDALDPKHTEEEERG